MNDSLELQVGSMVRVRGIRKPVVVTAIREEGRTMDSHFAIDFTCWRSGGTRTVRTSEIVAVIEA